MDIVEFFSALVAQWEEDDKCGLCWVFTAPLSLDALNLYQIREEDKCCVIVAITDLVQETVHRQNPKTTLLQEKKRVTEFNIHFLTTGNLGVNNYDEIKDHPLAESKWATMVKPIWDCVGEPDLQEWCEVYGDQLIIEKWRGQMRLDWQDMNYSGWTFSARLILNI